MKSIPTHEKQQNGRASNQYEEIDRLSGKIVIDIEALRSGPNSEKNLMLRINRMISPEEKKTIDDAVKIAEAGSAAELLIKISRQIVEQTRGRS